MSYKPGEELLLEPDRLELRDFLQVAVGAQDVNTRLFIEAARYHLSFAACLFALSGLPDWRHYEPN